ncbi:hypothetical protein HDV02_003401 [Globomyces sp. JEL0801]|nr:hypothetical protein HDV02_003401 [Globomyces sp. JEL0801]
MSRTKFVFPMESVVSMAFIGGAWIAGVEGVKLWHKYEHDGKPKRYGVDKWDRRMMERDSRLTGNANARAPEQFSRNSALELESAGSWFAY